MIKKSNYIYFLIIVVICFAIFGTLLLNETLGSRIVTTVTVVTALIGAGALFVQFRRDKKLNETNFVLNFSNQFYAQPCAKELMQKLEAYRKGKTDILGEQDYDSIVYYLDWVEEFALIVNKGILNFAWIEDLFDYRFFLIVNNPYVQKREILPEKRFYKNIYRLYNVWTNIKKKKKIPIFQEETGLDKTEGYTDFLEQINNISYK